MVKEKVAEATTEDKTSQKTTDKQGKSQEDKPTTDLRDTTKEQDNEFNFTPVSPAEQEAKRHKLWQIGLVLGGMLLAIVVLIVSLVAYSIGYNLANSNSSADDDNIVNVEQSSDSSQESDIPDEALAYQSQDIVGEGQIPDHYRGAGDDAQITVVEYADYACSHCISLCRAPTWTMRHWMIKSAVMQVMLVLMDRHWLTPTTIVPITALTPRFHGTKV